MKTISLTMPDDLQEKIFDWLILPSTVEEAGNAIDRNIVFKYPLGKDRHHVDIELLP